MAATPTDLNESKAGSEPASDSSPSLFTQLKQSFTEWSNDKAPLLSAALAYFALFSIAPLLLIAIAIAGLFFGQEATESRVTGTIAEMVGPEGAKAITGMVQAASEKTGQGVVGLVGGFLALLLGASGVFAHLKEVLNSIWSVEAPPKKGILAAVWQKIWSFGMVLSIGFVLLVSLLLSSAISLIGAQLSQVLPMPEWIWHLIQLAVSFLVITGLFAAMFKYIPDAEIEWRDVWYGAAFTSLLFVVGKFLIGLYLGRGAVASSYGAAGSVIIILLWLYYSSMIVLFGGEFTEVHARTRQGIKSRADRRKKPGTASAATS